MELKTILRVVLRRVDLRPVNLRAERQTRLRRFTTVPAREARVIVTAKRSADNSST